jgi:UPF0716 protein FxsA
MLFRLLFLFVVYPLVELYLLLKFASITSAATTIAVVILTALLGVALARRQGVLALWRFRQSLAEGRPPTAEIADTVMIVIAAGLLVLPGLLGDLLGVALLIPVSRRYIRSWLLRRVSGKVQVRTYVSGGMRVRDEFETIDATFHRSEEPVPAEPPRIGP